jgi:Fic family protein
MPGKPFQSRLLPYEEEIYHLLEQGTSYRGVSRLLNQKYGLGISHNAVYSFVKAASRQNRLRRKFNDGLDPDIRKGLLQQIVAVWTHGSNAIEGNTLTLGETAQVIELGLTISGKPLKDHQEAYGHARAIDLIRDMAEGGALDMNQIFDLHRAIMPKGPMDVMNPIGDWKREYNGTTGVVEERTKYIQYSPPGDVPALMKTWLNDFNKRLDSCGDDKAAIENYARAHMAFVRIHPFFDGNGRMARLLANIPVLRGGLPPILISPEQRGRYINILWNYHYSTSVLNKGDDLFPAHPAIDEFKVLLSDEWKKVMELVEEAKSLQRNRK